MKTKNQFTNRILSLVLAFVMVLGMMPMSSLTAFAASTPPEYVDSSYLDGTYRPAVFANGNDLIIEAGSIAGTTSVYYTSGGTKTAVVENADLSNAYIFAGYDSNTASMADNVTITMYSGRVNRIFSGHKYGGIIKGNITIIMMEDAKVQGVNPYSSNGNTTISGKLRLFAANGLSGSTVDFRSFDGQIVKKSSGWSITGDAVVPAGCTVDISEGTTVTIPSGATLTNNGTVVNNGTVLFIDGIGQFKGNVISGNGKQMLNLPYIPIESFTSLSVRVDGDDITGDDLVTQLTGNVFLNVPQGAVYAVLDGKEYYGVFEGAVVELVPYTGVTDIEVSPVQVSANSATTLIATVSPSGVLSQSYTFAITDPGTTGATLSGDVLTVKYDGVVTMSVTSGDGYASYTDIFTVTVYQEEVTGISANIPQNMTLTPITLDAEVTPANATYQDIVWSVSGPATVNGNSLRPTGSGTITLTATVKNGVAYGQDFVKTYTITVEAPTELDISQGSITITKLDDNRIQVVHGTKNLTYSKDTVISITGSSTTNSIKVSSGSPKLVLDNCRIDVSADNEILAALEVAADASADITLLGENSLKGFFTGIAVPSGASLVIDGSGGLTATATNSNCAGIGGNNKDGYKEVGSITINGGTIKAESPSISIGSAWGGCTVTINGGIVTANKGICGVDGAIAITINGGTVNAETTSASHASIGTQGWSDTGAVIMINGGNINASSVGSGFASPESTVHDSDGNSVVLKTITLNNAVSNTAVTALKDTAGNSINYNLKDVYTTGAKLYFYLPDNIIPATITAGGKEYFCTSTGLNYRTSHDWSNSDGICANCGTECVHAGEVDQCSVCGAALHTHQWEYTVSGTTVAANCKADGCPNDDGGSVTMNVTDAYFTDSAIGATVTGSFTNDATYKVTYNGFETVPSSIGTHTVKLTVYENGTEKQSVTAQYKISYLDAPNHAYAISGAYEDNGTYWFKTGAPVTVNAPNGYTVSKALNGTYGSSVSFSESDSKVIYLRRTSDGALTDAINVEGIRFDGNGATGKITIENRGFWEKLLNKITFGLFFKGDAVATVSAMDNESGWKSIQYYIADKDLINDGDASVLETAIGNNWKNYSDEIALNKNAKYVIYVKITDNVGNVTYISSEGIVLYSDAEAVTESVSTTYKAGADKDVTVKLNGNTVNAITNGDDVLTAGTDYTVSTDGAITLKASYLDTLNAGTYTFTVSYNPLGETYVEAAGNDAPATTTFKVVIEKADGEITNISNISKTYDGTAVTAPTFDKLGDGVATIEYKVKGKDDSTYATTAPKNAGDYVVRVTVAETGNYKGSSATAEFTIAKASAPIVTFPTVVNAITYGQKIEEAKLSSYSNDYGTFNWAAPISVPASSGNYALDFYPNEQALQNYDWAASDGINKMQWIESRNALCISCFVTVDPAPVNNTGNNTTVKYDGSKYDVSQMFAIDKNAGEATFAIVGGNGEGELNGSVLTVTKAGTFEIKLTTEATTNYEAGEATATLTVEKGTPNLGTVSASGVVSDTTAPNDVVLTQTGNVKGTFVITDSAMLANKQIYNYIFTPTDTGNWNSVNGQITIDVQDTALPTISISLDDHKWTFWDTITFGLFYNESKQVTITYADNENGSGLKDMLYFVTNKVMTVEELQNVQWTAYTKAFDIDPDGKYVIYAKAADNDGNTLIINSNGIVLDSIAPAIYGLENGGVYYGNKIFKAMDDNFLKIELDGVDITDTTEGDDEFKIVADNAEHTVTVTDKAGNVTEYKITVYKNYTVTFKADGEDVATVTVGHGKDATLPAVPNKEGYSGVWNSDGKNITEDTTITAVYSANSYKVSFDTNGGEAIDPITVTFGEKYGRLPSSSVAGLSGGDKNWYLVDTDGNVTETNIKNLTLVSTARDHKLFIKRNVLAPNVSIALTVPGGISDGYQYYIPGASQRVLTATVKNGNTELLNYTYQWYKDGALIEGATESVLTLEGNVADSGTYKVEVTATLKDGMGIIVTASSATGSYEKNVKIMRVGNTIYYDANGGEGGPQSNYTGGTSLNVSKDAPTREHYDFIGWNTKADGSGDSYKADDTYIFTEDGGNGGCKVTLYAQWKVKEYTVTYIVEGQTLSAEKVEYSKDATLPDVPNKEGYSGVWDSDGKNITSDTEINAVYTIKKYTVIYKIDGEVVDTVTVEHGKDATAPAIPDKEGYTQNAPTWDKDGKNITADTEISAVYTINKYTVTYKADGEVVATVTVEHGENVAFPKVPAKDGYIGKWDRNNENITSDTVINAVYTEISVVKPDEVKPEDKADLEDTKKQLEDMLNDDDYTEDDKKDIQEAIDAIDDVLEVIGNVEAVEELIDKLPDTIKKDDEAAIKAADDAYNALSDYEKSLVDEDAKKALDDAKAALAELNKPADPNSPATGDNSHMMLWIALLFISGGAVITLTVVDKKRRSIVNK